MRRSSRLILLLGAFLALGAFILFLFSGGPGGGGGATPTPSTVSVVVAAVDIPLGATIDSTMLTTKAVPAPGPTGAFTSQEGVVGRVARQSVAVDQPITTATFLGSQAVDIAKELKAGERAMAVQVDEVSGVGTLIQPGDRVDVILGVDKAHLQVVLQLQIRPNSDTTTDVPNNAPAAAGQPGFQVIGGDEINATTVKVLLQNVPVIRTLLSATTQQQQQQQPAAEGTAAPEPGLVGRTALVIVAVSAQQAEVLRYAQMEGTITLLLRSPEDAQATPDITTGVMLRTLIDQYGVLPPRFVITDRE